jgi:hypothetical protein
MSLTATVEDAVEQAFAAAGDLVVEGTWQRRTQGAYDPRLGVRAETVATRQVRIIKQSVSVDDVKSFELSEHALRLYIPGRDFAASPAISPQRDDVVVLGGVTYTAKAAKFEVTEALWLIHADL